MIVRIFLGPKYDVYGKELTLNEKRSIMIEMDKFKFGRKLTESYGFLDYSLQFEFFSSQLPLAKTPSPAAPRTLS